VLGYGSVGALVLKGIIHHSSTPVFPPCISLLVEFDAVLLTHPLSYETLRLCINLESFLDGFFEAITTQ
jgi:hypothetical protein